MSLFRKMFGDKGAAAVSLPPRQEDSTDLDEPSMGSEAPHSRSAPRKEVVYVVLRETMRRHGIPHDWIDCRALSMVQPNKSTGTYVTFVVMGGQDRLLAFVPSFQASFREALHRFDPRASDWLRGVTWEFADGSLADSRMNALADTTPSGLKPMPAASPVAKASAPPPDTAEQDRKAQQDEDDLEKDLAALFAIRDAALSKPGDFVPTQTNGL